MKLRNVRFVRVGIKYLKKNYKKREKLGKWCRNGRERKKVGDMTNLPSKFL